MTPTRFLQLEEFSGRRWNWQQGGKECLRELCLSRAFDWNRMDYCELRCEVQKIRIPDTNGMCKNISSHWSLTLNKNYTTLHD